MPTLEEKKAAKNLRHVFCDGAATVNADQVHFTCAKCKSAYLSARDVQIPMEI